MFRLPPTLLAASILAALASGCGVPVQAASEFTTVEAGTISATRAITSTTVHLDRTVAQARTLPHVVAQGPGAFDNALAMNIPYAPIVGLRRQLQEALGRPLNFFTGWNPSGEAHVTVLTPIEYQKMAQAMPSGRPPLAMAQIGEVAAAEGIQHADLALLGIGSGRTVIEGRNEETYFLIVESRALRQLRRKIHARYVASGGDPLAFDPERFYPHITIGFTRRDLHEADGVLKDVAHSRDPRFNLRLK